MRAPIGTASPRSFPGQPLPSHCFVRRADRLLHVVAQTELLSQHPRQRRVVRDHVVEVAPTRDRELEADTEPVQRRVATTTDHPQGRGGAARVAQLVLVLVRLQSEVVAEPLRLLVCVGVTPDGQEQRRVVHDDLFLVRELELLSEMQRDEALAKYVLHRLTEAEIDTERQRGDELRQPDAGALRRNCVVHSRHHSVASGHLNCELCGQRATYRGAE